MNAVVFQGRDRDPVMGSPRKAGLRRVEQRHASRFEGLEEGGQLGDDEQMYALAGSLPPPISSVQVFFLFDADPRLWLL